MMKKLTSRKLVSVLVVALFILSFAGIAVSQETQETQETEVEKMTEMTGMISDIWPDTGKIIVVEKESGDAVTLTAGLDVDLMNLNVGDHVVVKYTDDMLIRSINKQTK